METFPEHETMRLRYLAGVMLTRNEGHVITDKTKAENLEIREILLQLAGSHRSLHDELLK